MKTLKHFSIIVIELMMALGLLGCKTNPEEQLPEEKPINVTGIILNETELTLFIGEGKELIATVYPENATNKNVTWSSSNESVATVNSYGFVAAISKGETIITVTTADGEFSANCIISVKKYIPVTEIKLNKNELEMVVGDQYQLKASILPKNATNQNIIWSSSDENVASVNQNGLITANASGEIKITAIPEGENLKVECFIKVSEVGVITGLTLNETDITLRPGSTKKLTARIHPKNIYEGNITWSAIGYLNVIDNKDGTATVQAADNITDSNDNLIIATIGDSEIKAECIVKIKKPTATIVLTRDNAKEILGSDYETETRIQIPDSVIAIEDGFDGCGNFKEVTIPGSVISIGEYAFNHQDELTKITIPDSVTSIGKFAFANCTSLTTVTIGIGVTSIGENAFYNCTSLTEVTIGSNVTSIGRSAFEGCSSLKAVTIPDSVTSLGDDAFRICSSLKEITIGYGLTKIVNSFYLCENLSSATFKNINDWYFNTFRYGEGEAVPSSTMNDKSEAAKKLKIISKKDYDHVPRLTNKHITHSYSSTWSSDDKYHWYAPFCGCEKKNKAEHDWDDGKITKEPTTMEYGEQKLKCTVCGRVKTILLPASSTVTNDSTSLTDR